jgi:hypothetical protein
MGTQSEYSEKPQTGEWLATAPKPLGIRGIGERAEDFSIDQLQTWLDPLLVEAPRPRLRVWHVLALAMITSALLWWGIVYAAIRLL